MSCAAVSWRSPPPPRLCPTSSAGGCAHSRVGRAARTRRSWPLPSYPSLSPCPPRLRASPHRSTPPRGRGGYLRATFARASPLPLPPPPPRRQASLPPRAPLSQPPDATPPPYADAAATTIAAAARVGVATTVAAVTAVPRGLGPPPHPPPTHLPFPPSTHGTPPQEEERLANPLSRHAPPLASPQSLFSQRHQRPLPASTHVRGAVERVGQPTACRGENNKWSSGGVALRMTRAGGRLTTGGGPRPAPPCPITRAPNGGDKRSASVGGGVL